MIGLEKLVVVLVPLKLLVVLEPSEYPNVVVKPASNPVLGTVFSK